MGTLVHRYVGIFCKSKADPRLIWFRTVLDFNETYNISLTGIILQFYLALEGEGLRSPLIVTDVPKISYFIVIEGRKDEEPLLLVFAALRHDVASNPSYSRRQHYRVFLLCFEIADSFENLDNRGP